MDNDTDIALRVSRFYMGLGESTLEEWIKITLTQSYLALLVAQEIEAPIPFPFTYEKSGGDNEKGRES